MPWKIPKDLRIPGVSHKQFAGPQRFTVLRIDGRNGKIRRMWDLKALSLHQAYLRFVRYLHKKKYYEPQNKGQFEYLLVGKKK
jgi:hypothetical protein